MVKKLLCIFLIALMAMSIVPLVSASEEKTEKYLQRADKLQKDADDYQEKARLSIAKSEEYQRKADEAKMSTCKNKNKCQKQADQYQKRADTLKENSVKQTEKAIRCRENAEKFRQKAAKENNKVIVCHKGKEISVSENALKAHLAHGDTLGKCVVEPPVVAEPIHLETIEVYATQIAGTNTNVVLDASKSYRFVVSGTVTGNKAKNGRADAEYFSPPNSDWELVYDGTAYQGYAGSGEDQMDLQINSGFVNWGDYNAEHIYTYEQAGQGTTVNFRIYDGDLRTGQPSASWYGDNDGYLTVEIWELP